MVNKQGQNGRSCINRCDHIHKMSSKNVQGQQETTAVHKYLCAQIFLYFRIFCKAVIGSELRRLPRCTEKYKQSLS